MDMINVDTSAGDSEDRKNISIEVNENFYYKYESQIRAIVSNILIYANQPNDVDDCVNSVFLEIMEKLRQYNESRGSMGAFVAVIARSAALDYCKKNTRKYAELIGDDKLDFLSSPMGYQDETEARLLVESIIAQLNKQERLLFTMRFLCYDPPEEIAKILYIKRNTVDKRVSSLKNKIKKILAKGGIII